MKAGRELDARIATEVMDESVPDGYERVVAMAHIGKKAAGRLLDGREWNEMPKPMASIDKTVLI